MKEEIVKAYDIVIEQQRNADSKANLFIVLITAFLSFLSTTNIEYTEDNYRGTVILLWFLIVPLIMLILSLFPIYNSSFAFLTRYKNVTDVNIYYWESIAKIKKSKDFINLFKKQYKFEILSEADEKLLLQLKANSNILHRKVILHKIAFYILGQILILFILSLIFCFLKIDSNLILFFFIIVLELIFHYFLNGSKDQE